MRLKRLLLVCEPGKDGAFDHVARLIAYLNRQHPSIVVDLAFSSRRARPSLWETVAAVHERGGETVDLRIGNAPEFADLHASRVILRLIIRRRPQIVHAHTSKAGALCRLVRTVLPAFPRVVYTPHAYYGMGPEHNSALPFFNNVERLLGQMGVSVAASYDERIFGIERLGLSPRRVVLIDNGIDVGRFHPVTREERKKLRDKLGLPEKAIVLVSVGRASLQKNYAPLYRAMESILSDEDTPVAFVHAGAGAEQLGAGLSASARRRYRAYEHLEEIETLLAAADGFVLTSRYETLCLSVLQALASGMKVFLTDVSGNSCLRRIGFHEISWIDFHDDEARQAVAIEASLRAWLPQHPAPGPAQVELARTRLNSEIQFGKLYRLYDRLLHKEGRRLLPTRRSALRPAK